jgi:hypothetical protein
VADPAFSRLVLDFQYAVDALDAKLDELKFDLP